MDWKLNSMLIAVCISISCESENKPYWEFENKLRTNVCECISLGKQNLSAVEFMMHYTECIQKTFLLLSSGLEKYEEDPRISKDEYLSQLTIKIKEIADSECR